MIDSWAFIEQLIDGPQRDKVDSLLRQGLKLVTVRDAVVETFGFVARRRGNAGPAREWLRYVLDGPIQVLDPRLDDLVQFHEAVPQNADLSLVDVAVAWGAQQARTRAVATADGGFRAVGLDPLFAPA